MNSKGSFWFGLGVVILSLLGFGAAGAMVVLKSQAGNTVAEAFYNAFGLWATALIGLAIVAVTTSWRRLMAEREHLRVAQRQQLLLMVTGSPADWHEDPTGEHELRYWDGSMWTAHVSDNGVSSTDEF